ncbi:MAG: thioredoxin-like domain-containing protein [Byssovorax sp.]
MRQIAGVALVAGILGCSAAPMPQARGATTETGSLAASTAGDLPPLPYALVALPAEKDRGDTPGFEGASAWINVDHPLTKDELRGRVVIVDFWTSCCINCLQTLPVLRAIEDRFRGRALTVVGIHSPKFDEEKQAGRLQDVVRDNRLEHPIAVDGSMAIWRAWGVESWPTVAVLDVEGRAVWAASGEPALDELTSVVASALDEGQRAHKLARGPLRGVRVEAGENGPLRYPGKVLALKDGGLAIADTGHDRVVVVSKGGKVEATIGSGLAGKADGSFAEASFSRPEGLAEVGADLYVADTGNHTIRKIDRAAHAVTTVAGTGEIGGGRLSTEERPARSVGLRSPWDLLEVRGNLVVALAGSHQIGAFDPRHGTFRLLAGNGHEARADGPLLDASFAQPSALATDGTEVFVLDSETSSVRAIDVAKGQVRTVVGEDLFVFGDVDGDKSKARLQHPIGLAYGGGALWVADSYNSKVKRVDPATGATRTVISADLSEPAGLGFAAGTLFIADTNHHRVRRWAIDASAKTEAVALGDLAAPSIETPAPVKIDARDPTIALGPLKIPPGASSKLQVRWDIPKGTGVNDEAPFRVVWATSSGLARLPAPTREKGTLAKDGFEIAIEPLAGAKTAELTGVLDMVVCDVVTHAVCLPVRRTLVATFAVEPGAALAPVTIPLPAAAVP